MERLANTFLRAPLEKLPSNISKCFLCLLFQIGSGTYSNVYKAVDLDKKRVVALKKVRVDGVAAVGPGEPQKKATSEAARFMVREIALLRRLGSHPNIVKLDGLVTSRVATSPSLYLVFEYMDHDLAGLAGAPGVKFSLSQVCYWILK
jgi:cyclin-dependent kinase 12/13